MTRRADPGTPREPGAVVAYFGPTAGRARVVVAAVFSTRFGWRVTGEYPVTTADARALHDAGVTTVELRSYGRTADFTVTELLAGCPVPRRGGR